jgi:hypothetical protein
VLSIYLANSFKNEKLTKSLIERSNKTPNFRNNILKIEKIKVDDKELYVGIFSKKIFNDYIDEIIISTKSLSQDYFEIKKMTYIEKLFLKLPFLSSAQKNREFYNNSIYVASDNNKLYDILEEKDYILQIINFFKMQLSTKKMSIEKIYNYDNEFFMQISLKKQLKLKDISIDELVHAYSKNFFNIFNILHLNQKNRVNTYDKIAKHMEKLRFIIALAFFGSFFSMIYNSHKVFPQILDTSFIVLLSVLSSIVISIIAMLYILMTLKHSSFALLIVHKYIKISFFAFLISSYYIISYINTQFDTSKSIQISREIIDKRKNTRNTSYYVKFKYIYAQSITGSELRVPYEIYKNNNYVTIYIKNGFLNIKYVDDIK